jgi:two-component system LytT family response regulator
VTGPEAPTLRVLIAEDEPLARLHLRELVAATPGLTLAGEAADGITASRRLAEGDVDLVFLDIGMPRLDGVSLLERLADPPAVVFTTAYDVHAVQAFELGAVDYLLKPFGAERFARAVARVRDRLEARPAGGLARGPYLAVREFGRVLPIPAHDVHWVEAEDDFVRLHLAARSHLLHGTLAALLDRLPEGRWVRIHRSRAVNLDHVLAVEDADGDRVRVRLRGGIVVRASRTGTRTLRAALAAR